FEPIVQRDDLDRKEIIELGLRHLLEECDKDKTLMRAAFTGQAGIQCLSLLKSLVSKLIADRILILHQISYNFDSEQLDVIADFYAGALIGTIQGWLVDESGVKSMDTVVNTVGRLFPNGLDSFITKS
ncbi:MAG: hypothetical protein ACI9J2_002774, partial [Saprospiraceae bacterium]